MLKLNKKRFFIISLAIASIVLAAPFINGLGCNASFIVRNTLLGTLYGQCEYGSVKISVDHNVTQETYSASGFLGYWQGRYFIILTSRDINQQNKLTPDIDIVPRPFYYRDFYTGDIFPGVDEETFYIIYLSPEPTISDITLHGSLGFLS